MIIVRNIFRSRFTPSSLQIRSRPVMSQLSRQQRQIVAPQQRQFAGGADSVQPTDYDPEYDEREIMFNKMVASIQPIERKDETELLHGEEGGMIYKYDLPIINQPIVFHNKLVVVDQEREALTQVEELFDILDCDKDTAYQSFIIKFNQEYNHEVDMYGDIRKAGDVDLQVLDFGIPIPHKFMADEANMKTLRSWFKFNQDIPGAIEVVHPNKFLPNLRSVEDFRHTPLIPISEKDMTEYKKKIEERNRRGYYVEIKKDTIYFYTIACISLSIIFYTFMMVNEKQMRIRQDIERTKTLRYKANRGRDGLSKTVERKRDDLLKQDTNF